MFLFVLSASNSASPEKNQSLLRMLTAHLQIFVIMIYFIIDLLSIYILFKYNLMEGNVSCSDSAKL